MTINKEYVYLFLPKIFSNFDLLIFYNSKQKGSAYTHYLDNIFYTDLFHFIV